MTRCENADVAFEPELSSADPHRARAENGMRSYWIKKNSLSIDGLPGVQIAPFAKDTPRSGWMTEHKKRSSPTENGTAIRKAATVGINAKLIVAFSLGVLTTAIFMRLSGLMV